jgi:hypothetical protein
MISFHWVESKYTFYSVLLANIVLLCFTRFYPSMDGPAHLYNANIIHYLIKGNTALNEFYSLNQLPVPNWISHFMLAVFRFVMPAWLAEKVLVILYVSGMALSFRYLIRELNPGNTSSSILVFPFIYSFLFHLGFYSFCISFILYFGATGYWMRIRDAEKFKNYFMLFVLITLTYFSSVLTYAFLGVTLGVYVLFLTWYKYRENQDTFMAIRNVSRKLLYLLLVSLPSIVLLVIFYQNVTFYPTSHTYTVKELIKWINDVRPLIVFGYASEEVITEQFLHILLILIIIGLVFRRGENANEHTPALRKADIMLVPLAISLYLLFFTPDGSGAGMMSDRFCLLLYVFLLIWTVSQARPAFINRYIILITVVLHFGLLLHHMNGTIRKLNNDAINIHQSGNFIEDNSIVLPVNLSDHWLQPHFSNYLGVEKPLVILENYEANVGWFPVKWNLGTLPEILLGDKNAIEGLSWPSGNHSGKKRQIDYILVFGNINKLNTPTWKELKKILSSGFRMIHTSGDGKLILYERRTK